MPPVGDTDIPDELLEAAKRAAAPQLTPRHLLQRFGPPEHWQVTRGVLWRASWAEQTALVLVVTAEQAHALVAPVTVEPTGEDEDSLVLQAERTALRQPATVWAALARRIPLHVLDRPIDDLGEDIANWCEAPSNTTPAGTRRGRPLASPFELDTDVRALADDDLAALADAAWATEPTPSAAAPARGPRLNRSTLTRLQQRLGLPLPDVLALVDGKRPATPQEAAAIEEVTGITPPPAPALPQGLIVELSHPRWRPAARAYAHHHIRPEPQARLMMAYEINAMAARQTGDAEPAWRDRVARWAAAQGLEQVDP